MGIWDALWGHTHFPGLYKSALWGSLLQNRVRPRSITGWIAAWALCGGDEVPWWPIKPKIPPIKPILNSILNSTLIKSTPNSTLKHCTDQAYFPLWWLAHQQGQALWGLNAGMPHQEPLRNGSQSKPGLLSRHAIGAGTDLLWHSVAQCGKVWQSVAQCGTVWHRLAVAHHRSLSLSSQTGKMVLVLYIVSKQQTWSN